MYLEDGQCAQCGKHLGESAKFAPHNRDFQPNQTVYRPYFCSEKCVAAASEQYAAHTMDQFWRDTIKTMEGRIDPFHQSCIVVATTDRDFALAKVDIEESRARDDGYSRRDYGDGFKDRREEIKNAHKVELVRLEKLYKEEREREIKTIQSYIGGGEQGRSKFHQAYFEAFAEADMARIVASAPPPAPVITEEIKFEHTLCLAPSGAGKTTLMFKEITDNLAKSDPPAMVIIDPKGTVLQKVTTLACFHPVNGKHKDRLIIIDPTDLEGPPAFNLFKPTNSARLERYDANSRAVLENKVVELLQYTFSSRNQPLTGKQAPCFAAVCRLMLKMPNPDLSLLFDILNDQQTEKKQSLESAPTQLKQAVAQLPELSGRFFKEQYYSNYTSTRDEISSRLYGIVEHPSIQSVFNAKENRFDMFDALQTGKIVIVNVPNALLTSAGAELFGRYMIALTLAAAFERVTIRDKSKWKPAFLYVDEFHEFADENKSAELLRLAREFNLGVFMCLQGLSDLKPDSLRAAVLINTRIKYASSITVDANAMANEMNCDSDFFHKTHKSETHVRFACHVRGLTKAPAIVGLPLGAIDKMAHLDDAAYEEVLKLNRRRVSAQEKPIAQTYAPAPAAVAQAAPTPPSAPQSTPKADDEAASSWS
jgi:hypothetical protein